MRKRISNQKKVEVVGVAEEQVKLTPRNSKMVKIIINISIKDLPCTRHCSKYF